MTVIPAKTAHVLTNRVSDHLDLRCGKCGSQTFAIHVKVGTKGEARISRCRCTRCGQIRPFDNEGVLQGSGRVDLRPLK